MPKYLCVKNHIFSHPAKTRKPIEGQLSHGVRDMIETYAFIETYVCPECQSIHFTEYVEPEATITSVKSVDLAQVDDYLQQGYVVRELYAKTATLVKLAAAKVEQPDPDSAEAFLDEDKTIAEYTRVAQAKAQEVAESSFKENQPQ